MTSHRPFAQHIPFAHYAVLCAIAGAALVLNGTAAHADGMPFKVTKPAAAATSLDKALDEIQNKEPTTKTAEKPTSVVPMEKTNPAVVATPPPAPAQETVKPLPPPVPESRVVEVQPDTSFFGLSVGMYDPFTHGDYSVAFGVEFQPGVRIAGVLQPLFGGLVTTSGALLGYGGIGIPVSINDHWMLTPSVAIGAYKPGGGIDLERTVVYRGGAELAYVFDNKSRLGLNFHILTNGTSLGRDDRTEVIGLSYTAPFELVK